VCRVTAHVHASKRKSKEADKNYDFFNKKKIGDKGEAMEREREEGRQDPSTCGAV
jgi:hypothetical protein